MRKKLKKGKNMDNFNEDPSRNEGWYEKWHKHPRHQIWQWVFLILVILFSGWALLDRINEPEVVSYGLNSKASNSQGKGGDNLFSGVAGYSEESQFGKKAELVDVETDQIEKGAQKMQFKLPDGPTIVVNLKNLEKRGMGNVAWRGSVEGQNASDVTLTLKNGYVAGTIVVGNELYEIRPSEGKKHVVEKMDGSLFPSELDPKESKTSADTLGLEAQTATAASISADVVQIDLLSVYTPQARDAAGGVAQIDALIQAAVDNANTAFMNSQVNAHYNLVATALANHNDAGDLGADLGWVQSDSAVATLRNQYGADLVSLVVQNGAGYCGMGYVMNSVSSSFASSAFQVTAKDCAVGNLSFAHEHGHNIGMQHDPANGDSPSNASYPWSFGHFVNGVFRTVMSYASPCSSGCTRVAYFSNPNVMYAGYPTGIADQRDNARTANLSTPIVAGFRGVPPPSTIPVAPSALLASAQSSSQIRLAWTDNSPNESGFKIERSMDGTNFTQIASVGANVVNYTNTGLSASTMYYYRVKAYTSAGDSTPSNTSSATTQDPDTTPPVATITANGKTNKTLYNITVAATDNVAVKSIQIVVGGVVKKTCSISTPTANPSPCSVNLKVNSLTNGSVITGVATDTSGNVGQSTALIAK